MLGHSGDSAGATPHPETVRTNRKLNYESSEEQEDSNSSSLYSHVLKTACATGRVSLPLEEAKCAQCTYSAAGELRRVCRAHMKPEALAMLDRKF